MKKKTSDVVRCHYKLVNNSRAIGIAAIIFVLCARSLGVAQQGTRDSETGPDSGIKEVIDSLANRNKPPEIVRDRFPIFSEKYDWAEQRRILDACLTLVKRDGAERWPLLVEHMDDKRYAFTCLFDTYVCNVSIGDICSHLVRRDLSTPGFWPARPGRSTGPDHMILEHKSIPLPWRDADLDVWCRARRKEELWKVQLELAKWCVKTIEGLKTMPGEKRAELLEKVRAMIDVLERTKKPMVDNVHAPFFDQAHYYNAPEAKNIRDEYRTLVEIGLDPKSDSEMEMTSEEESYRYLGKPLSKWLTLAKHKNSKVRVYAARALGEPGLGRYAKPASLALAQLLKDKNREVRQEAEKAFLVMGRDAEPAISALAELLKDESGEVRAAAASALRSIGPEARAAVPLLKKQLNDKDKNARRAAAEALDIIAGRPDPSSFDNRSEGESNPAR